MIGLTRRLFRALAYTLGFFATACLLLLVANKNSYININGFIPYYLTPAFFQPASGSYIIDLEIRPCLKINGNSPNCGVPRSSDGLNGDLNALGGWIKVDKDLTLGSSLLRKNFLSYKVIQSEAFKNKEYADKYDDKVITDIAVYQDLDGKIEGNKQKLPLKVLLDFRSNDIYDDEDTEYYGGKGVKGELYKEDSHEHKASKGNKEWQEKQDQKAAEEAKKEQEEAKKAQEEADEEREKEANEKEATEKAGKEDKTKDKSSKENGKEPESEEPGEDSIAADFKPEVDADEVEDLSPDKEEAQKEQDTEVQGEEKSVNAQGGEEEEEEEEETPKLHKRVVETDISALKIHLQVPTEAEVKASGWTHKTHGIWVKYESHNANKGLTALDVLFGKDAVDPRPNWTFVKRTPVTKAPHARGREPYLTFRRGPKIDYSKEYPAEVKVNKEGKLKILQVADLHFATGVGKCRDPVPASSAKNCEADPRTLEFLEKLLDLEKPDLVVMTGDQVFGDEAPDSETALFKAVNPFIRRKIPFACTLGNHDDEGSMPRNEMMSLISNLPYSFAANGPEEVAGFGNYVVNVRAQNGKNSAALLYFLDTHKYSPNPKVNPGYDWLKDSQLAFVEREYASFQKAIESFKQTHLSMAFFHIPIPEYRNMGQPFIGEKLEGITAPRYNTGARKALAAVGVKAISVGHDHCNDYCLIDSMKKDEIDPQQMWLCYGGGIGQGGYGGYGGYVRRARVFEFDVSKGEIKTWKRLESEPDKIIHAQIIVTDGNVVNFAA